MTEWKTNFQHTLDAITAYHYDLTHPDEMAWGRMTAEEADNIFNQYGDYDKEMYDEWGTHSQNMLINISCEKW